MKKISTVALIACALALSAGIAAHAEEGTSNPLKDRFEKNKELRNERIEDRKDFRASTTAQLKDMRGEFKDMRRDIRATTTAMFKEFKDQKRDMLQKMRKDFFQTRKDALVKELTNVLYNLTNIEVRIEERIGKAEESGRDMTEAKAALVIAQDKLATAKTAVTALAAYTAPTTTASSTENIDLAKPRQVGDAAIKAVKEARDALKKVVELIGKNMGWHGNKPATTTPPVISTSTATTTN